MFVTGTHQVCTYAWSGHPISVLGPGRYTNICAITWQPWDTGRMRTGASATTVTWVQKGMLVLLGTQQVCKQAGSCCRVVLQDGTSASWVSCAKSTGTLQVVNSLVCVAIEWRWDIKQLPHGGTGTQQVCKQHVAMLGYSRGANRHPQASTARSWDVAWLQAGVTIHHHMVKIGLQHHLVTLNIAEVQTGTPVPSCGDTETWQAPKRCAITTPW